LHNILLEWDGLSVSWEADMDWAGEDGHFDEYEVGQVMELTHGNLLLTREFDASSSGRGTEHEECECDSDFHSFRELLVTHYQKAKQRGKIVW
jgi:hypothetical protein